MKVGRGVIGRTCLCLSNSVMHVFTMGGGIVQGGARFCSNHDARFSVGALGGARVCAVVAVVQHQLGLLLSMDASSVRSRLNPIPGGGGGGFRWC